MSEIRIRFVPNTPDEVVLAAILRGELQPPQGLKEFWPRGKRDISTRAIRLMLRSLKDPTNVSVVSETPASPQLDTVETPIRPEAAEAERTLRTFGNPVDKKPASEVFG